MVVISGKLGRRVVEIRIDEICHREVLGENLGKKVFHFFLSEGDLRFREFKFRIGHNLRKKIGIKPLAGEALYHGAGWLAGH